MLEGIDVNTKGLIFNIQRFSIHDGPGIRTTVFMKGCPLACKWCSNPESQKKTLELMTIDTLCTVCGRCAKVCPEGAIMLDDARHIDRSKCNFCLKCIDICPNEALKVAGEYMSVDQVVAEVLKDKAFYRKSGGGVTISGGEPLLQWRFVNSLLKECQANGVSTAIETSGYAEWDIMRQVIRLCDLVLMDIKTLDPVKHKRFTGVGNELILSNFRKTSNIAKMLLRYPVIPGINDAEADAEKLASFVSEIPLEKISLLPYHEFGSQKYRNIGCQYSMTGTLPPTEDHLARLKRILETSGVNVCIGS